MLVDVLLEDNPLFIIDVGASGGIDSRWSDSTCHYKSVLFEPDKKEYQRIKSNAGDNSIVLQTALLDMKKETDFYICKNQELSSVYLPNFKVINNYNNPGRFEVIDKIRLTTDKLDNVLKKNKIKNSDFIKLDTQGSELSLLNGSKDYLEHTIGLQVEAGFVELYDQQPLFNDVDMFMKSMNFQLIDIKRYFWKRKQSNFFSQNSPFYGTDESIGN